MFTRASHLFSSFAAAAIAAQALAQTPYLVKDMNPAPSTLADSNPRLMTRLGARVLFVADTRDFAPANTAPVQTVFATDGTAAGTVELFDGFGAVSPGSQPPTRIAIMSNLALVPASVPGGGMVLWATDGTPPPLGSRIVRPSAGPVSPFSTGEITELVVVSDRLALFVASTPQTGWELWKTDGTPEGTAIVRDINPAPSVSGIPQGAAGLIAAAGVAYFRASDGTTGLELWRSDGTAAGTRLVADLDPRIDATNQVPFGSNPQPVLAVGADALFVATIPATGTELWRTYGAGTGAIQIHESAPGSAWFGYSIHGAIGERALFSAVSPLVGQELFASDPGAMVSRLIADLNPGAPGSAPTTRVRVNDRMLFQHLSTPTTQALFSTDGSLESSTPLVPLDFSPTDFAGEVLGVIPRADGRIIFIGKINSTTAAIYRTDGSPRGTFELARLPSDAVNLLGSFAPLSTETLPNGTAIFFIQRPGIAGGMRVVMWTCDGTPAGTRSIAELSFTTRAWPPNLSLRRLGNGRMFFATVETAGGVTSSTGRAWFTDGTGGPGTDWFGPPAFVLRGPSNSNEPATLMSVGGRVIASAQDGLHGYELWSLDGTTAGSSMIANLRRDRTRDSTLALGPALGSRLLFYRTPPDSSRHNELWITDGTEPGTIRLAETTIPATSQSRLINHAVVTGGRIIYLVQVSSGDTAIWTSNGTPNSAVEISAQITPPIGAVDGPPLVLADGRLVLSGSDSSAARRYAWVTDGTAQGTRTIPGLANFLPTELLLRPVLVDGSAIFVVRRTGEPFASLYRFDGQTLIRLTNTDADPASADGSVNPSTYLGASIGLDMLMFDTWPDLGREPVLVDSATGQITRLDTVQGSGAPGGGCTLVCPASIGPAIGDYFPLSASEPSTGAEPWLTDGRSMTVRRFDINPGPASSYPCLIGRIGNRFIFAADSIINFSTVRHVFAADVADGQLITLTASRSAYTGCGASVRVSPTGAAEFKGGLLFSAGDQDGQDAEPWFTDGTTQGTRRIADVYPGRESGGMAILGIRRDRAYFMGIRPAEGSQTSRFGLFRTDGTEAGTIRLADMPQVITSTDSVRMIGNRLYFLGTDLNFGTELYALDLPSDCFADFDSNGAATLDDLFGFLAAYLQQSDAADVTGEGVVGVDDIFEFLRVYFLGC